MPRHEPGAARLRAVEAAARLFYDRGIPSVSLDDVARTAGVSKATLYAHFPGKDDLVSAALDHLGAALMGRLRAALEAAGDDPDRRVDAAFSLVACLARDPGYRGCPYLNAAAQTTDPTSPLHTAVHRQVQRHKDELHHLLRTELDRGGHPDPAGGADALLLLLDGALFQAVVRPDTDPVATARALARLVMRSEGNASP